MELRTKHQDVFPHRSICGSLDIPPALPERRLGSTSRNWASSKSGPPVPARPSRCTSGHDSPDGIYEVVDAVAAYDRKASVVSDPLKSSKEPTYIGTKLEQNVPVTHPWSEQDNLYEPPIPVSSNHNPEPDASYIDVGNLPNQDSNQDLELYMEAETLLKQLEDQNPDDLYEDAETSQDQEQNREPNEVHREPEAQTYVVMERANGQMNTKQMEARHIEKAVLDRDEVQSGMEAKPLSTEIGTLLERRVQVSSAGRKKLAKMQSGTHVTMNSIIDPNRIGTLKRKKDKTLGTKWIEQTVVVKDNMIFFGGKDLSGDVAEFFSLSDATIETTKSGRQKHVFEIRPKFGKNVCFAAQTADEMQEWISVFNRAASKAVSDVKILEDTNSDQLNPTRKTAPLGDLLQTDEDEPTKGGNSKQSAVLASSGHGNEVIPEKQAEHRATDNANSIHSAPLDTPEKKSGHGSDVSDDAPTTAMPQEAAIHENPDTSPVPQPSQEQSVKQCAAVETNPACEHDDIELYEDVEEEQFVYRAVKSHQATDDDELSFEVGDLILIDSTSDDSWWSGTLQDKRTREFTGEAGFVPKSYFVTMSSNL